MSFLATIEADVDAIEAHFAGSPIAVDIKADYEACIAELETVGVADLETAVKTIGVAVLGGLATGGTSGAIAAGIAAAPAAFATAEKAISASTITTLVGSITNQVSVIPAVVAAPTA